MDNSLLAFLQFPRSHSVRIEVSLGGVLSIRFDERTIGRKSFGKIGKLPQTLGAASAESRVLSTPGNGTTPDFTIT